MLVDDNDTDNFISGKIIEMTGFSERVIAMDSGSDALEYLRNNSEVPENIPEVIFLDINMPYVDGFVFLFEFEKLSPKIKAKSKIIILSSSDNKRDIDRIVDNPLVIHYIVKPLSVESLQKVETLIG